MTRTHRRLALSSCLSVVSLAVACGAPALQPEVESETQASTAYGVTQYGPGGMCDGTTPLVSGGSNPDVDLTPSVYLLHWGAYYGTAAGVAAAAADVAAWSHIGTDPRFWQPLQEYTGVVQVPSDAGTTDAGTPEGGTKHLSATKQAVITPPTNSAGNILFGSSTDATVLSAYLGPATLGADGGTNASVTVPQQAIWNELQSEIANNVLPSPVAQPGTIFVIVLPPGAQSDDCQIGTCSGVHWPLYVADSTGFAAAEFSVIPQPAGGFPVYQNQFYASVPLRPQDVAISHEIYEGTTDMSGQGGGYGDVCNEDGGLALQEIADLCESPPHGIKSYSMPFDGYTIATFWSDANIGCVGPGSLVLSVPTLACGKCAKTDLSKNETCAPACPPPPPPRCPVGETLCGTVCAKVCKIPGTASLGARLE